MHGGDARESGNARLEALGDRVIALIITIVVLEMKVPMKRS